MALEVQTLYHLEAATHGWASAIELKTPAVVSSVHIPTWGTRIPVTISRLVLTQIPAHAHCRRQQECRFNSRLPDFPPDPSPDVLGIWGVS